MEDGLKAPLKEWAHSLILAIELNAVGHIEPLDGSAGRFHSFFNGAHPDAAPRLPIAAISDRCRRSRRSSSLVFIGVR